MGRRRPAGPRTASRTCWAISPMSSAAEPPVPSSDRCVREGAGEQEGKDKWVMVGRRERKDRGRYEEVEEERGKRRK